MISVAALFSSDLNILFDNFNGIKPSCSLLVASFNAKLAKWCSVDKDNKATIQ